jgi:hypothetical protein
MPYTKHQVSKANQWVAQPAAANSATINNHFRKSTDNILVPLYRTLDIHIGTCRSGGRAA